MKYLANILEVESNDDNKFNDNSKRMSVDHQSIINTINVGK